MGAYDTHCSPLGYEGSTLCDLEQLSGHAVLSDQSQKPSCCALPQKRYKQQTSKFDWKI